MYEWEYENTLDEWMFDRLSIIRIDYMLLAKAPNPDGFPVFINIDGGLTPSPTTTIVLFFHNVSFMNNLVL